MKLRTSDYSAISEAIKAYVPFTTHGSLWGEPGNIPSVGFLPLSIAKHLRGKNIDYAIYSYGTPIAWRVAGEWELPDVKYSHTTTRHQNTIRVALGVLGYDTRS